MLEYLLLFVFRVWTAGKVMVVVDAGACDELVLVDDELNHAFDVSCFQS